MLSCIAITAGLGCRCSTSRFGSFSASSIAVEVNVLLLVMFADFVFLFLACCLRFLVAGSFTIGFVGVFLSGSLFWDVILGLWLF